MTSTNQAFIDAFRSPVTGRTTVVAEGNDAPVIRKPFVGTSEFVSAATRIDAPTTESTETETAPAARVPAPFRLGETGARRAKRPLSSLRAAIESITTERPTEELPAELPVANQPTWPVACQRLLADAAEQYDAILRKLPAGASTGTVMGIVGAARGVGCTTTAICLALRSAALGYSTVLVDADFAGPSIAKQVKIEAFEPWDQLMQTSHTVAPALVSSGDVAIDLLLAGPATTKDLDATSRFRVSLAAGMLRRNYQRVIVDLGVPDTDKGDAQLAIQLAAAMGVDHLLAAVAPPSTSDQLDATLRQLSEHGLDVAGLVQAA